MWPFKKEKEEKVAEAKKKEKTVEVPRMVLVSTRSPLGAMAMCSPMPEQQLSFVTMLSGLPTVADNGAKYMAVGILYEYAGKAEVECPTEKK